MLLKNLVSDASTQVKSVNLCNLCKCMYVNKLLRSNGLYLYFVYCINSAELG